MFWRKNSNMTSILTDRPQTAKPFPHCSRLYCTFQHLHLHLDTLCVSNWICYCNVVESTPRHSLVSLLPVRERVIVLTSHLLAHACTFPLIRSIYKHEST